MHIEPAERSDSSEEAVTYSPSKVSWGMAEFVASRPSAAVSYSVRLLLVLLGLTVGYASFFEAPHTVSSRGVLAQIDGKDSRLIALVQLGVSETLLIKKGMRVILRVDGVSEKLIPPFEGVIESIRNEPMGSPPTYSAAVSGPFSNDARILSGDSALRPGMHVNAMVVQGYWTPLGKILRDWFNIGVAADRS